MPRLHDLFWKWVKNNIVVISVALPNLVITFSTLTILEVGFGWPAYLAPVAYLIGQFFSVQYSVLFNWLTKARFSVGRRTYRYSHKDD